MNAHAGTKSTRVVSFSLDPFETVTSIALMNGGKVKVYIRTGRDGRHYCTAEDGTFVGAYRQIGAFTKAIIRNRFGFEADFRVL